MYAITVRQPFAWAIVEGEKDIENRSWALSEKWMGRWIAIHAAKALPDVGDVRSVRERSALEVPENLARSAIVGVARLSRVVTSWHNPWFRGPFGWVLGDRIAIRPVPDVVGQLGLWRLSADLESEVERRVRESERRRPTFRRYWLVKGKAALTDWSHIARVGAKSTWFTRRPPKDWAAGDGVVLWEAAPGSKVIGFGELAGPSRIDAAGVTHFSLKTTLVLSAPLSADELRRSDALADSVFLKSGPAGTVFRLRTSEMEAIEASAHSA